MVANINNNLTADKHDMAVVQASSKAVTDDRLWDEPAIEAIGDVEPTEIYIFAIKLKNTEEINKSTRF